MQVGSSSPFPLSQHNPSPRYHPHSQREDHGDVEYDEDVRDDSTESHQQVHMPFRGEKKRERPEDEERDQPTHPRDESEDQRPGELPEESFSSPTAKPHSGQHAEDAERTESRTGNLNDEGLEAEGTRERDEEGDQKKQDQSESKNNQVDEQLEGPTSQEQSASQHENRQDDTSSETREQRRYVRQEQSESATPEQQEAVQRQSPTQTPTSNEESPEKSTAKDTPPDIEGTLKDSEEGDKESDKGWTRVEPDEGSTSNTDQNEEHFTKPTMSLAEQIYHSELPQEPEVVSTTPANTANKSEDTEMRSSPFPNLKEEPSRDRVSEKSAEATNQSHRNLVPTVESFRTLMRQDEKPKHKEDHHHTFFAQAHNDYGKKPHHHHDEFNQPNPRAEHPPMQAYAAPVSVDMGLRRQEGGGEMNVFQTEDRRRVHDAIPPNDAQRAQWDMNEHQSHHLHQQDLQQKQQHLAHVSMIGMASVTIEAQRNEGSGENIDFDLERERLARLQSETARLHGGVILKDSDVSLAQSEVEKQQRRQQEEFNREEQVIAPVVCEGTYMVPVDTQERDANEEESKRLHHIHDNIGRIKTGAHVDAFDKK